jgi:heme-degrading monooxygenase HmoA
LAITNSDLFRRQEPRLGIRTLFEDWFGHSVPQEYLNLFSAQVQAKLSTIRGFRRSLVLVREHGEETEIVTITFFERLEDIVAFAGDQYEIANVSSEARAILSRFDEAVSHFEVALELPQTKEARSQNLEFRI